MPFESIPGDRWFRRSLLDSIRRLSHTVSVFAASLGDRPADPLDPSLDSLARLFLGPRLLDHLERETPGDAALDSRISSCVRLDRLEDLVAASATAPPRFRPYRPARAAG